MGGDGRLMNMQEIREAQGATLKRVHFIGDSHDFPDVLLRLMHSEFDGVAVARYAGVEHLEMAAHAEVGPALAIFGERFAKQLEDDYDNIRRRLPVGATPVLSYRKVETSRRLFIGQRKNGQLQGLRFLPAEASIESWVLMMRLLLKGDPVIPCEVTENANPVGETVADTALDHVNLTKREAEVLDLMASGKGNKHIAAELGLSYHTVKLHIHNVFTKIGVRNRAAATHWYLTKRTSAAPESAME